jgi:hypothetical protein
MAHSGGCLCGKVRYEIDAEPITARACWCRDCQKVGAGGPTVNAAFPSRASSCGLALSIIPRSRSRWRRSGFRPHRVGQPSIRTCHRSKASRRHPLEVKPDEHLHRGISSA